MAYDEGLELRLRELLGDLDGVSAKKMFGGLAIMIDGNMATGVFGDELLVRADPADEDEWLSEPGARVFDMVGRPMKGWIVVAADACAEDEDLARWAERGVAYARTFAPK